MVVKKLLVITLAGLLIAACDAGFTGSSYNIVKKKKKYEIQYDSMSYEQLMNNANLGDSEAQYRIANKACCGVSEGKDTALAFRMYCEAAKQGHWPAQFELGSIYSGGIAFHYTSNESKPFLVPKDISKAHMWYSIAGDDGYELAEKAKKKLVKSMSFDQLNESFRLRKLWRATPCTDL